MQDKIRSGPPRKQHIRKCGRWHACNKRRKQINPFVKDKQRELWMIKLTVSNGVLVKFVEKQMN